MYRIVADPNVLISAAIAPHGTSGGVVRAMLAGRGTLIVSPMLLDELRRVLHRPRFRRYLSNDAVDVFIALLADLAERHADQPAQTGLTRDPNDDYLVALARGATADYLVSGDADLLEMPDAHPPVLTPRAFLDLLAASDSSSAE